MRDLENIWNGLPKGAKTNARALAFAVLDAVNKECPYHEGSPRPSAEGNCIERVSRRIKELP